jgi:AcrR family transcriptional regulator
VFQTIVSIHFCTMPVDSQSTKERIFQGAEQLFGKYGFSDASLRQITDLAGVNLAAANYHFHSKENLYRQVFLRRVRPVNEERLTLLTQAEQLAGDQPVPLRAVLDTFIRPLLRRAADDALGGTSFLRLMSRALSDPQPFMQDELAREFEPLIQRYTHALAQAVPGVPAAEIFWRMQFVIGAMIYTAAHQHDFERVPAGDGQRSDLDASIRRLVDFCAGGLSAPSA